MLYLPKDYHNKLSMLETQIAIKLVKDTFERKLAQNLGLIRVSAPLFVDPNSGLNDNLNGVERPVRFTLTKLDQEVEIVQSLAKWKRMALKNYQFSDGMGLYTDMNAIRPEEETDNLHSIYVDQWDWEKIITKDNRNIAYLKQTVRLIIKSLNETNEIVKKQFPVLDFKINEDILFITSQELLDRYPNLNSKARENAICKDYKTVFIIGIGDKLSNGLPHDNRAPDYDDWHMNGDILVWSDVLQAAVELSSMGIRVDEDAMIKQLTMSNNLDRLKLPYHQAIMKHELPLTIGGGIGQSRVCQVLLQKLHIGEVQVSYWKEEDLVKLNQVGAIIL